MTKSLRQAIHERRRILQNPYAYLDELDEMNSVRQQRRKLENPYAHIERLGRSEGVIGRFDGVPPRGHTESQNSRTQKKDKYSESEIELIVRAFQAEMWRERAKLFGGDESIEPLEMLDPSAAFHYLNYDFDLNDTLGQFSERGTVHEVAGTVDQQQRKVRISSQFSLAIRNFTAAHELGHALLHESVGLHRDRPLTGPSPERDQREYEADKFATFFLMPRKIVIAKFKTIFGRVPFALDHETRFALLGAAAEDPRKWPQNLRQLARVLASVTRFNGREIVPLANQFRVSVEAMAIRLEELGLIAQS